jgi:hypothetical protein
MCLAQKLAPPTLGLSCICPLGKNPIFPQFVSFLFSKALLVTFDIMGDASSMDLADDFEEFRL